MAKSLGDLQFLSDEFSKLEVVVAPAVPDGGESSLSLPYHFCNTERAIQLVSLQDPSAVRDIYIERWIRVRTHVWTAVG